MAYTVQHLRSDGENRRPRPDQMLDGQIAINTYPDSAGAFIRTSDDKIAKAVKEVFDFRPGAIVESLDLLRPIYRKTAAYGHFGRTERSFTWERTDKAEELAAMVPRSTAPLKPTSRTPSCISRLPSKLALASVSRWLFGKTTSQDR